MKQAAMRPIEESVQHAFRRRGQNSRRATTGERQVRLAKQPAAEEAGEDAVSIQKPQSLSVSFSGENRHSTICYEFDSAVEAREENLFVN
jgi:hypothetical protein